MTILNACPPLRKTAALAVVAASMMAAPVLADAIAGCVMPLLPKSDELTEREWEPRELMAYLGEEVRLQFESPNKESISVIPHYTIWSRKDERRPILEGRGSAFNISPGLHPMNLMLEADTGVPLVEALYEMEKDLGSRFVVTGARVHDHKETRLWTEREKGTHAITFNVSDAKPRKEATRSHMLVVFAANAGGRR